MPRSIGVTFDDYGNDNDSDSDVEDAAVLSCLVALLVLLLW